MRKYLFIILLFPMSALAESPSCSDKAEAIGRYEHDLRTADMDEKASNDLKQRLHDAQDNYKETQCPTAELDAYLIKEGVEPQK